MSEITPATEATTPAPVADSTPTEPVATAPAAPKTEDPKPNPWEDPDAAKAEIERLRRENGAARTTAKQQAAEEARSELAQQIGKALGLVKDEPVDPAVLTDQLTASQAAAKSAQIELAVFRAATVTDADASALLDSRAFLEKVAKLDPTDTPAFTAAIAEAVTANPRLGKATQAAPGMKPNPAQGRSDSPPLGIAERIAAATAAGDIKTAVRLKASQALNTNN
jgi:hypothetical protein